MGHLKKKLFRNSIENYEKMEKYGDPKNYLHVSPNCLDVYAKELREFDISSKLFLLLCYVRHWVTVTDLEPATGSMLTQSQ